MKFEDILYAKSEHIYVNLFTTAGKDYLIRTTMNSFCERMPEQFFRTHRSYMVNLNHLNSINSLYVIIQGNEVPVGKTYRDLLMNRIHIE